MNVRNTITEQAQSSQFLRTESTQNQWSALYISSQEFRSKNGIQEDNDGTWFWWYDLAPLWKHNYKLL